MHTRTRTRTHARTHKYTHARTHARARARAHTHTHTHTHTGLVTGAQSVGGRGAYHLSRRPPPCQAPSQVRQPRHIWFSNVNSIVSTAATPMNTHSQAPPQVRQPRHTLRVSLPCRYVHVRHCTSLSLTCTHRFDSRDTRIVCPCHADMCLCVTDCQRLCHARTGSTCLTRAARLSLLNLS